MIQEACTYIDEMPDKETKLKFIETLRTVTAGKVPVTGTHTCSTYCMIQYSAYSAWQYVHYM